MKNSLITKMPDFEEMFEEKYHGHATEYKKWHDELKERSVLESTIITFTERELAKMKDDIYPTYSDEFGFTRNNNPYLVLILDTLDDLIALKDPAPYTTLIKKRNTTIKESANWDVFYNVMHSVKLTDEELIDLIAKLRFYEEKVKHFYDDNTFHKWQEERKYEVREVIVSDHVSDFLNIEKKLFQEGYINELGKWEKEIVILIAFYEALERAKLWKKRKVSVNENAMLKEIRKFLSTRYQVNIEKQFQRNFREKIKESKINEFENQIKLIL